MKIHNFSAGPCILPTQVFQEASEAMLNFDNLGLSIVEISHRSKNFVAVMDEAVALVKELLHVPNSHEVIFIQGGASLQFAMTAFNFLSETGKAQYLDTGVWASKAFKEASGLGDAEIIASSKDKNYSYIPKDYTIDSHSDDYMVTIKDPYERVFVKQVFYGCIRYEEFLKVFNKVFFELNPVGTNRNDQYLYMVFAYMSFFRLEELSFEDYRKLILSQDPIKMHPFL